MTLTARQHDLLGSIDAEMPIYVPDEKDNEFRELIELGLVHEVPQGRHAVIGALTDRGIAILERRRAERRIGD